MIENGCLLSGPITGMGKQDWGEAARKFAVTCVQDGMVAADAIECRMILSPETMHPLFVVFGCQAVMCLNGEICCMQFCNFG
jgi:hypothetical protein